MDAASDVVPRTPRLYQARAPISKRQRSARAVSMRPNSIAGLQENCGNQRPAVAGALAILVNAGVAAILTSTSRIGCSVQAWVT